MKLTLDVNHPLAQAIRRAVPTSDGRVLLQLTVANRDFTHTRTELVADVMRWSIEDSGGKHARDAGPAVLNVDFLVLTPDGLAEFTQWPEPPNIPPITLIDSPHQITDIRGGEVPPREVFSLAFDTRLEHTWIGQQGIEWTADPLVIRGWIGRHPALDEPIRVPPTHATDPYGPFRRKETTR